MSVKRYEQLNQTSLRTQTKLRVAAYCRVSTDREDQINSFESQQRFFRQYIQQNPDWIFHEIYADEGLSGTSTKKRKAFNQMISCAKQGKFDLILTKEISRFARNTLDSIYFTRDLKKHGVGVIFLNDNINTLDGDSELRLAIMSSIAQEESRRTSERVKWGQRRQMEQGIVFGRSMLGYDVRNGKMYINESGAEIVRLIFHKFVYESKTLGVIGQELLEAGCYPVHAERWNRSVLLRILRNEKYCGDLVQKKTYTPDYLSHEKKYNNGEESFVILKDHHTPIISRELYDAANRILDNRKTSEAGKTRHSCRYPLSGKITCGLCGHRCAARRKTRADGSAYLAWRCQLANRAAQNEKTSNGGGCMGRSIQNEAVITLLQAAISELHLEQSEWLSGLFDMIELICDDPSDVSIRKKEEMIDLLMGKSGDAEFYSDLLEQARLCENNTVKIQLRYMKDIWVFQKRGP